MSERPLHRHFLHYSELPTSQRVLYTAALLVLGTASVIQWHRSELHGSGDLRFYAALQLYAVVVLLLMLALPARYTRSRDWLIVVALYVVAKLLEICDRAIFAFGHFVSGHTLKHLAAAAAGWCILRMLQKRRALSQEVLLTRQTSC